MSESREPSPFEFSGGALCLDYLNTLGDRPEGRNERLRSRPDLLRWGVAAGLLEPADVERAADRPRAARDASELKRALVLRESLYRIFSDRARGRSPDAGDVAVLNEHLRPALSRLRLGLGGGDFRWEWSGMPGVVERVLWPVARSASELLTSPDLGRIRECASESCSWLFLDYSRSRRRRWCDMKTCGNRAKARRHYRRRKARQGGAAGRRAAGR